MRIIFVMGIACAGKSTYIKNNFKNFEIIDLYDFQKDVPILNVETCLKSYENCKEALLNAIKENKDVVMEHTLLRAKRRKPYIDAVKELGDYDIECVCINPPKEILIERKKQRNCYSFVDEEINTLEIPQIEEGFSNVLIVSD